MNSDDDSQQYVLIAEFRRAMQLVPGQHLFICKRITLQWAWPLQRGCHVHFRGCHGHPQRLQAKGVETHVGHSLTATL